MTAEILFYIILGIVCVNFIFDQVLDRLNTKAFNNSIPEVLSDVYDNKEYKKSQSYKAETNKISQLSGWLSFIGTILFLIFDGFAYVDDIAREYTSSPILVALVFFGIIMLTSDLISTPFSYYSTFVIEEKYGFNKMTKRTFWLDKIKGLFLGAIIGGCILSMIIWFFELFPETFWIYALVLIAVFSIIMNMFYARLIVPLFNKQSPLEEGSLRKKFRR